MKLARLTAALVLNVSALAATSHAQKPAAPPPAAPDHMSPRAEAYYDFTIGHLYEMQYEQTSQPEFATRSIDAYKRAYALDPQSPIIGERLAEMYWKAQRIHDAEVEANQILKRDPNDLATHRLLARIYLRRLGDLNGGTTMQTDSIVKAIAEYNEVHRLDPSDTEAALWLARLYRLHNEPNRAEAVLRGMLKDDPDNDQAMEQLTQLLLDQNQSQEAIELLKTATVHSPSPTLYDLLGDAYTQIKDFPKAEEAYRKASEMDPSEMSHLRGLGQTLLAEEKYDEALEVYQKLSEQMPDDPDVYLAIAKIYREKHDFDKAEENLVKARQYAPNSLEVMYNEAMIYESQGRYEDAIRVLSSAVTDLKSQSSSLPSRRRNLAILYQQLGQLYRDTQNYQAAIYSYQELAHLGEEEDRRSRLLLMETYRQMKDLPKALQAGKDALVKYPDDADIRASYAGLLGDNQQPDEAVKLLSANLKNNASDRMLYLNIAQVYERARRYKEAEEAARKAEALATSPSDNEMTWFLLGAIYERQKLFDKSEEEFKKALAVDPKNGAVLNYYGYMLADRGYRLDEAKEMIDRALEEEPFNGAYLDSLGWVYYKQSKLAEAEATLHKALEHESHDPTIRSHLGDVYAKEGKMDLAAAEWERSLSEWHRSLPGDLESDKVAELERKLGQAKHRVAQKAPAAESKP